MYYLLLLGALAFKPKIDAPIKQDNLESKVKETCYTTPQFHTINHVGYAPKQNHFDCWQLVEEYVQEHDFDNEVIDLSVINNPIYY